MSTRQSTWPRRSSPREAHAEEALRIAECADHPFTLAEALTSVGSVSLAQGDLDRAIDALERARVLTRTWNFQPWAVLARLGDAYTLSARSRESVDLLEEVIQNATTMSSMGVGRAMQLAWLGEAYLLEGRLDDAQERALQAVSLAQHHQERGHEAWGLRLLGEIAARRDSPVLETAEGHYRQALALAGELGMRPLAAHCHFHLSKLFRKTDQHEQARRHLTTATTMYREMDMRFSLEHAKAEMRELA
jgi:tetratricopeptide (TPR) repeat protein